MYLIGVCAEGGHILTVTVYDSISCYTWLSREKTGLPDKDILATDF
jgi:hypothetical protein